MRPRWPLTSDLLTRSPSVATSRSTRRVDTSQTYACSDDREQRVLARVRGTSSACGK